MYVSGDLGAGAACAYRRQPSAACGRDGIQDMIEKQMFAYSAWTWDIYRISTRGA